MPSGRYLTAQVTCYGECIMQIEVKALSEDVAVSQGLCGNYDGDPANDLTQGGLSPPSYTEEPIQFTRYFMLEL